MSDSSFLTSLMDSQNMTSENVTMAVFVLIVSMLLWVIALKRSHPNLLLQRAQQFDEYPLIQKDILSHDTRRFTFALPTPHHTLGLPVGQHMTLRFTDSKTGKSHQRSYTPVTTNSDFGKVSFVIKVYRPNKKFPQGGQMSQHLDSLQLGDSIQMKGPKGHLWWQGSGVFRVSKVKKPLEMRKVRKLNLIAGGTGITPMLQILHAIFPNPADTTNVKLLYANQTEDDILVREELETLAKNYPDRFQLHYTLDRPPATKWKYSKGFITKEMMEKHLFTAPDGFHHSTQTFMCGPPPMIRHACLPALEALGFTEDDWVVY